MGGKNGKFKYIDREDPLVHWQIKGDLGSGSYGKVHLVQNRQDRSEAAAKVADIEVEDELYQFTTEIDMLANCRHPNITAFLAAYYDSQKLWIIIEKCAGGALTDALSKRNGGKSDVGMNELECSIGAAQSISALEFLHAKNIIHRDLNAANILLSGEGNIKIADFGVSAYAPKGKCNSFIGSPCWMAPEVILCEQKPEWYSNTVDIWSLGVTIIEFAETNPPHHDQHPAKAMIRIIGGPPPKLSNPSAWSQPFSDLLAAMLVKDGTKRKSASALMIMPFVVGKQHQSLMSLLKAATKPTESYENWTAPPRPPKVDPVTHRAPPSVPAEDGGAPPPRPAVRVTQSAESGYGIPAELLEGM